MSEFTLDTSGGVLLPVPESKTGTRFAVMWSDLDPFTQGYVEAMFAGLPRSLPTAEVVPTEKRAWVMDYMARQSHGGHSRNINTGTTYDDGADFCEAFGEAFPGRKPDPNLKNASKRLAKLLRAMWCDGQLQRGIIGNEKYLPQEPSWQYVYSLYPRDVTRLRETLDHERCSCGELSHIREAACVHCGRTKAWAQPPAFSDLHPDTLSAIRKDCGAFQQSQAWRGYVGGALSNPGVIDHERCGQMFWNERQKRAGGFVGAFAFPQEYAARLHERAEIFPPLMVTLSAAGRVVFARQTSEEIMGPFEDGYVAAMRDSLPHEHRNAPLADETLAAIRKDCAALVAYPFGYGRDASCGTYCWKMRKTDWRMRAALSDSVALRKRFPPLAPYLGDDGRVYLREAG